MSKYTIRNRASVMHFDIEVEVFIAEQLEEAVQWLVDHHYSYEWDYSPGDSAELAKWSLRVPEMCWANNLEEFAKVLGKSDYQSDVKEDEE